MKVSDRMIAVPASAWAAGQANRPLEARQLHEALTGSDSPVPQQDRLTGKFEAALSAALRRDASTPARLMPSSVDESLGAAQRQERPPSQEIVSGGAHSNDRSFGFILEADQLADLQDARIQASPEPNLDPALRPPLVPPSQTEPDGSSPRLAADDLHPSEDAEDDSLGQLPKNLPSEHWELQTDRLPHKTAENLLPQDEEHCDEQGRSTEPANLDDPIDPREDMSPQRGPIAHWLRQWGTSLTRRGAIPVAVVAALACTGAILLLPAVAPGSLQAEHESDGGAISDGPAVGVADREASEQKWTISSDNVDQESAVHIPQEPITPKLVKTVRISGSSEEPDDALPRPELPSLGPLGISAEQAGKTAIVGTDANRSNKAQVKTESSGAGLTESAVRSPSPAERVEVEGGDSAPIEETLVESQPQAAESVRWPNAIRSEDGAQTGDRMAAAGSADDLDLPDGDPALRRTTGTMAAPESSPAETADTPASASVGGSQSAEPTRFAPVTTDVNMRAGQGNDAAVITVVPAGARVGVIACATWCEVVFEGERGWIHRSLVTGASGSGGVPSSPADRQIAAGTPLISADGAQIGIIRGLSADATGQDFVIVDLAHELEAATSSIRLRAEYIAAADGQARINVTRARFMSSLRTQTSAEASTTTGAN